MLAQLFFFFFLTLFGPYVYLFRYLVKVVFRRSDLSSVVYLHFCVCSDCALSAHVKSGPEGQYLTMPTPSYMSAAGSD